MFDLGIAHALANHTAQMHCGCVVQNFGAVSAWVACGPEHDTIMHLGTRLDLLADHVREMTHELTSSYSPARLWL